MCYVPLVLNGCLKYLVRSKTISTTVLVVFVCEMIIHFYYVTGILVLFLVILICFHKGGGGGGE